MNEITHRQTFKYLIINQDNYFGFEMIVDEMTAAPNDD